MYEELIEKLDPKPKFNLDWYNEKDYYSDGDVEDTIVNLIAQNQGNDYTEAIANNFSWATYYHLTHTRRNILNWYPFNKNASVLEIGCGFGAITSLLCDKCKRVTAVELSERRATGALLRCREYDNLEIIVGNLNDIEFSEKYDYITLIGVLEYQGSYTNTEDPYRDFLIKVKSLLKDNGKLFIAIENQYGLKYWCGAPEDHTGIPFDGMNQYTLADKKVRTFSKNGLDALVKKSGFSNTFFYYPLPDYKLPTVIYSEKRLPQNDNFMDAKFYYTNAKMMIADEKKIYSDIIDNDVFPFFSNSFLVECSDCEEIGEIEYARISGNRYPEYRIGTKIGKNNTVIKYSQQGNDSLQHLKKMLSTEELLTTRGIKIAHCLMNDGELEIDYIDAPILEDVLLQMIKENDKEGIIKIFDEIYTQIGKSSDHMNWKDNIMYTFDWDMPDNGDRYGDIISIGYLDMISQNAFFKDEEIIWFDQEWTLENVPIGYVMYRCLNMFYGLHQNEANKVIKLDELAKRYNVYDVWDDYIRLETLFMGAVIDQSFISEENFFMSEVRGTCINNISNLLKQR